MMLVVLCDEFRKALNDVGCVRTSVEAAVYWHTSDQSCCLSGAYEIDLFLLLLLLQAEDQDAWQRAGWSAG